MALKKLIKQELEEQELYKMPLQTTGWHTT
jgi:hypothetical protein